MTLGLVRPQGQALRRRGVRQPDPAAVPLSSPPLPSGGLRLRDPAGRERRTHGPHSLPLASPREGASHNAQRAPARTSAVRPRGGAVGRRSTGGYSAPASPLRPAAGAGGGAGRRGRGRGWGGGRGQGAAWANQRRPGARRGRGQGPREGRAGAAGLEQLGGARRPDGRTNGRAGGPSHPGERAARTLPDVALAGGRAITGPRPRRPSAPAPHGVTGKLRQLHCPRGRAGTPRRGRGRSPGRSLGRGGGRAAAALVAVSQGAPPPCHRPRPVPPRGGALLGAMAPGDNADGDPGPWGHGPRGVGGAARQIPARLIAEAAAVRSCPTPWPPGTSGSHRDRRGPSSSPPKGEFSSW